MSEQISQSSKNDEVAEKDSSEEIRKKMEALVSFYNRSGTGRFDSQEFAEIMKTGIGIEFESIDSFPRTAFYVQMKKIHEGIDFDRMLTVSMDDVINCLVAYHTNDYKYIAKMYFKGSDINNEREEDISNLSRYILNLGGMQIDSSKFKQQCTNMFGKKQKLQYWEFYKVLTGETISPDSPDYDPYEGQLKPRSSCCFLI